MGLLTCPDCNGKVSDQATACPHCGRPVQPASSGKPDWVAHAKQVREKKNQQKSTNQRAGCILFSLLATSVFILIIISSSVQKTKQPGASRKAPTTLTEEQKELRCAVATATARAEEANCRESLQCWGDKYDIRSASPCKTAVESMAKYDFEWTDGWTEAKFPRFKWADQGAGTLTYVGDKIKFQNGFGAWQHMRYECDYDPSTEKVTDVRVSPK